MGLTFEKLKPIVWELQGYGSKVIKWKFVLDWDLISFMYKSEWVCGYES
jgi:hypothetical protein